MNLDHILTKCTELDFQIQFCAISAAINKKAGHDDFAKMQLQIANNLMAYKTIKGVPHLEPLNIPSLLSYRDSLMQELHQKEDLETFAFKLLQKEVVKVNSLIDELQIQERETERGEAA